MAACRSQRRIADIYGIDDSDERPSRRRRACHVSPMACELVACR
jgi:hypothetical protein